MTTRNVERSGAGTAPGVAALRVLRIAGRDPRPRPRAGQQAATRNKTGITGCHTMSLRQESSGKEEETRTWKPFSETLRVGIPPGKAGPAVRSESCVVVGRPILRSVDSQVKGRVIEPRKLTTLGAFVLDVRGGRVRQLTRGPLSLPDPAGVEEHGQ